MPVLRYILVILFFLPNILFAQNGAGIEQLMTKRVITHKDASYNIALQLPRLHNENKQDTIAELINYTEENFGSLPAIVPYIIITQIKAGTFKETIKNLPPYLMDSANRRYNTIRKYSDSMFYTAYLSQYYLRWYADNFFIVHDESYPLYFRVTYGNYFAFLSALAKETLQKPGLMPAEKWLLNYFIKPTREQLMQARDKKYEGTALRRSLQSPYQDDNTHSGVGIGLTTGTWIPTGNLSIVGNHPFLGYVVGGRSKKFMCDVRVDIRFLRSPNTYQVVARNRVFNTDRFWGLLWGLDAGYELTAQKKHAVEILGGLGWEYFQALSGAVMRQNNLRNNAGSLSTLNLNAGLGYKFFYRTRERNGSINFSYVSLYGKYNFLYYNNSGGSDLSGGAFTIGMNYGFYSRNVRHYYINM
jgi:hypothetical protein